MAHLYGIILTYVCVVDFVAYFDIGLKKYTGSYWVITVNFYNGRVILYIKSPYLFLLAYI